MQNDIFEIMLMSYYINTFMGMLNTLLKENGLPTIEIGIGISTAKEHVIKAGRKDTGINSKVWIGEAVSKASKLSGLGGENSISPIVLSSLTYSNVIDIQVNRSGDSAKEWFNKENDHILGTYYHASIIKTDFHEWINNGMKD